CASFDRLDQGAACRGCAGLPSRERRARNGARDLGAGPHRPPTDGLHDLDRSPRSRSERAASATQTVIERDGTGSVLGKLSLSKHPFWLVAPAADADQRRIDFSAPARPPNLELWSVGNLARSSDAPG